MKKLVLIFLTLTCVGCNKQTDKTKDVNYNENQNKVEIINYNYLGNDLSQVFIHNQEENLGIFGDDNYRFYIIFDSVIKKNDSLYQVIGRTNFKNNLNNFEGFIKIDSLVKFNLSENELNEIEFAKEQGDVDFLNRYKYEKFKLVGNYQFNESKDEKGSGVYIGKFESFVFLKDNKLIYDDIELSNNDSYYNNHFTGIWKSNMTGIEKINCWANFRIPCSKGLDIGSAEFVPSEKFLIKGWGNYYKARVLGDKKAIEIENLIFER